MQYIIGICVWCIDDVYMGVMIVLEGYRDCGIVEGIGVKMVYAFSALISLYSDKISFIYGLV